LTPHSGAAEEAARPGRGLPGLEGKRGAQGAGRRGIITARGAGRGTARLPCLEGKHGPGAIPRPDPPAGLLATTPTPRRAVANLLSVPDLTEASLTLII